VIELEYDDVRLAAVDAGMYEQVLNEVSSSFRAPSRGLRDESRLLTFAIARVVGGVHDRKTRAAPRLTLFTAAPDRRELGERFDLAAAGARPCLVIAVRRDRHRGCRAALSRAPAFFAHGPVLAGVCSNVEFGERLRFATAPARA